MTRPVVRSLRLPPPRLLLPALVLLALLLRFGNMYYTSAAPTFRVPTADEYEHHRLALTLAGGDWLGLTVGPYHRPSLFAHVMAALFTVFGPHFLVTHIFLGLVDSAAVAMWYLVARRCFPRVPAFLGALFVAIYGPFIHFAGTGYMESFALALNGGLLLTIATAARRLQRRRNPRACIVLAGLLAGLSVLTRPQALLMLPVIAAALWWIAWRFGRSLLQAVGVPMAFAIVALLTMSPNAIRHLKLYQMWAPLGTGSELNFHMSNNRDGWGWEHSSPGIEYRLYQSMPFIEGGVVPSTRDTETIEMVRRWWAARNAAYLREEPGRLLGGIALKGLQVLNAREVHCTQNILLNEELSPIERYAPGLGMLGPTGFAALAAVLGGAAIGLRRRKLPNTAGNSAQAFTRTLLAVWVVVYLAGVALFLAIARHRLPAMPPLMLLSGWGAWRLAVLVRRRDWWQHPWLFATFVGLVLTRLPVIPEWYTDHERWWTRVNLGVARLGLDEPELAVADFRAATEIMPEKMEGWLQLAVAHNAAGNPAAAIDAQKHLLEIQRRKYPKYYNIEAEITEGVARYQIAAGRVRDAEATIRTLGRIVPGHPVVERLRALLPATANPGS